MGHSQASVASGGGNQIDGARQSNNESVNKNNNARQPSNGAPSNIQSLGSYLKRSSPSNEPNETRQINTA